MELYICIRRLCFLASLSSPFVSDDGVIVTTGSKINVSSEERKVWFAYE